VKLIKAIMRPPGKAVEYRGYAEMMREIQEALDPLTPGERSEYRRQHSRKFQDEHADAKIYLSEDWLENLYAKALPEKSIADLEEILDVINRLRKEGIAKRSSYLEQERQGRNRLISRMMNAVLRGKYLEKPVGGVKPTRRWLRALLESWKPDRVAKLLDGAFAGMKDPGPFMELLQDQVNEAWTNMKRAEQRRVDAIMAKMKTLRITADQTDLKRLTGFTWLGRTLNMGEWKDGRGHGVSAERAMYWMVGMQNERTRRALLAGNALPEHIVHKAIGLLTPQEIELAEAIAADFEDNFPRLREAYIDTFNDDLPGEDHYVPMRRLEISYETRSDEIAADMAYRNGMRKRWVARGPTYERIDIADEHQRPIAENLFGLWRENVRTTEGFIHQDGLIKRMHAVLECDGVRAAVQQVYGPSINRWLSQYINDLAQADAYRSQKGVERMSRIMRSNAAIAYLGFNITTNMKQLTGVINYLADAGPLHLISAAAQFLGGKIRGVATEGILNNTLVDFVDQRTTLLKERQINQEMEDLKRLNGTVYNNIVKKIGTVGMVSLAWIDKATVYIGWKAVYDANLKKSMLAVGNDSLAIEAADKATVRTQPSARVQDMAQMYRGGEILKWFTMFTSELSAIWNRLSFDVPMAIRRGELLKAGADLAAIGLVGIGIAIASGALHGDDDEEKKKAILRGIAAQFADSLPFIGRDVSNVLQNDRYFDTGVSLIPATEYLQKAIYQLGREDYEKALGSAARLGALLTGLPMIGVGRAMEAINQDDLAALLGWANE
jgi:hypothetical protein